MYWKPRFLPAGLTRGRRQQPVLGIQADPFGLAVHATRDVVAADGERERRIQGPEQMHAASQHVAVGERLPAVGAQGEHGMRAAERHASSPVPDVGLATGHTQELGAATVTAILSSDADRPLCIPTPTWAQGSPR